jgi:hypothetical protein
MCCYNYSHLSPIIYRSISVTICYKILYRQPSSATTLSSTDDDYICLKTFYVAATQLWRIYKNTRLSDRPDGRTGQDGTGQVRSAGRQSRAGTVEPTQKKSQLLVWLHICQRCVCKLMWQSYSFCSTEYDSQRQLTRHLLWRQLTFPITLGESSKKNAFNGLGWNPWTRVSTHMWHLKPLQIMKATSYCYDRDWLTWLFRSIINTSTLYCKYHNSRWFM